jgi:hypothetical protein
MVIIDTTNYLKFLQDCSGANCIFFAVTNSNTIHPAVTTPILLFVKNVTLGITYILNLSHYDFSTKIDIETITNDLKNLNCNKFVVDKKKFLHSFQIEDLKDLQLVDFIKYGKLQETDVIPKSYNFFYNRYPENQHINQIIPYEIHLKLFQNLCDIYEENIEDFEYDVSYENINKRIIENLQQIEMHGLHVDTKLFSLYFKDKSAFPINDTLYTEYNIYTSTGRPSNRFGGINYAALKKEDGSRRMFTSRHGQDGMLFLIDWSAYHPHIVAKLINYSLPENAYEYLGKFYYGKDTLTEEELKLSKNLTFQCMYGNIPPNLLLIPFYKKMSDYINHRWQFFCDNGYVETPIYGRRITNYHIVDPNPNKLFNYILQASETEFGMSSIENVNSFLKDKKTKPILYTYDSLLFDIHALDGKDTLISLKKIMMGKGFPVKCYVGYNYNDMSRINI